MKCTSIALKTAIIVFTFCISSVTLAQTSKTLKIATFNIQNLGKSKIAKPKVVDTIVTIMRMFDIIAVQEISDVSNTVAYTLLKKLNNNTYHYKFVCSQRTGIQADDKSSQEQYAFFYNSDIVTLLDTALFVDSTLDLFQREPYIAYFKTNDNTLQFTIGNIHTNPERAVQEIASLYNVSQWIPQRFGKVPHMMFCGDFNASCAYAKPEQLEELQIYKKPFYWIIPHTVKTNLAAKSSCAYDRFVVTDKLVPLVKKWAVLPYFKTKAVSDHWPVYIELQY